MRYDQFEPQRPAPPPPPDTHCIATLYQTVDCTLDNTLINVR